VYFVFAFVCDRVFAMSVLWVCLVET